MGDFQQQIFSHSLSSSRVSSRKFDHVISERPGYYILTLNSKNQRHAHVLLSIVGASGRGPRDIPIELIEQRNFRHCYEFNLESTFATLTVVIQKITLGHHAEVEINLYSCNLQNIPFTIYDLDNPYRLEHWLGSGNHDVNSSPSSEPSDRAKFLMSSFEFRVRRADAQTFRHLHGENRATLLQTVAFMPENEYTADMVEILLDHGADPAALNPVSHQSAIAMARERGKRAEIVALLDRKKRLKPGKTYTCTVAFDSTTSLERERSFRTRFIIESHTHEHELDRLTVSSGEQVKCLRAASALDYWGCFEKGNGEVGYLPTWVVGASLAPAPTTFYNGPSRSSVENATRVTASYFSTRAFFEAQQQQQEEQPQREQRQPQQQEDRGEPDFQYYRLNEDFSDLKKGELLMGVTKFGNGTMKCRHSRPSRGSSMINDFDFYNIPISSLVPATDTTKTVPISSNISMTTTITSTTKTTVVVKKEEGTLEEFEQEKEDPECPICFDEMYFNPLGVFLCKKKRTCRHFLHFECAKSLLNAAGNKKRCPICRSNVDDVLLVPDYNENPLEWFKVMDFNKSGNLTREEVLDICKVILPLKTTALEVHMNEYWLQWTKGKESIGYRELCEKDGLLTFIRRNFALKEMLKLGLQVPPLNGAQSVKIRWFEFFDEKLAGELSKEEVFRGLVKTYKLQQDLGKLRRMQAKVDEIWTYVLASQDTKCDLTTFIRPGGLGDFLVEAFEGSSSVLVPSPMNNLAELGKQILNSSTSSVFDS